MWDFWNCVSLKIGTENFIFLTELQKINFSLFFYKLKSTNWDFIFGIVFKISYSGFIY